MLMHRAELLTKVQQIQRLVHEEPVYTMKPRGGNYKAREAATTIVRDPNLEACTAVLQELENEHEFLCVPSSSYGCMLCKHILFAQIILGSFTAVFPPHMALTLLVMFVRELSAPERGCGLL